VVDTGTLENMQMLHLKTSEQMSDILQLADLGRGFRGLLSAGRPEKVAIVF